VRHEDRVVGTRVVERLGRLGYFTGRSQGRAHSGHSIVESLLPVVAAARRRGKQAEPPLAGRTADKRQQPAGVGAGQPH
jgi:hypothetical protein